MRLSVANLKLLSGNCIVDLQSNQPGSPSHLVPAKVTDPTRWEQRCSSSMGWAWQMRPSARRNHLARHQGRRWGNWRRGSGTWWMRTRWMLLKTVIKYHQWKSEAPIEGAPRFGAFDPARLTQDPDMLRSPGVRRLSSLSSWSNERVYYHWGTLALLFGKGGGN